MKFFKATAAVMLLGLLTGMSAAFAHDRDDGEDRDRPVQSWDRGEYRDHRYRDDDGDYWRERHYRHWRHEHQVQEGYYRERDGLDRGSRVVIGLPMPPLVFLDPPRIKVKVKRLRLPPPPMPVILVPRPY